jgi:hypothetical protein
VSGVGGRVEDTTLPRHPAPGTRHLLCLLLSAFCLLPSGCGPRSRGDANRRLSPDTARRELFLRGLSYQPEVFIDRAGDGDHVAVRRIL